MVRMWWRIWRFCRGKKVLWWSWRRVEKKIIEDWSRVEADWEREEREDLKESWAEVRGRGAL